MEHQSVSLMCFLAICKTGLNKAGKSALYQQVCQVLQKAVIFLYKNASGEILGKIFQNL